MTPIHPDTLQNNIPVDIAAGFTANWREAPSSIKFGAIRVVHAFNISKDDIGHLNFLIPHDARCRADSLNC